ncbi:hypothetical protein VM1G_11924 [Cytospora mali]|uniref:Uncharacterized protein n=1 Tax=Cytospora mali TaxID=578113 RepID=A0A194WD27_CYTMA|nr:hypothetical protein VM1G_11924 [Valsa mali]
MSNSAFNNSGFPVLPLADRLFDIAAPPDNLQQYAIGGSQDDAIIVSSDNDV